MESLFDTSVYTRDTGMKEGTKLKGKAGALKAAAIREAEEIIKSNPWPDNYHVVTRNDQMMEISNEIKKTGAFVFDLETSDTRPWHSKIYSCGIRTNGHCWAIPFEHSIQPTIEPAAFKRALAWAFADPDVKRMNHNLPFDCHFLEEQFGIPQGTLWCDTMLMAWVINSDSDHGLKELCALYGIDGGGKNYTAQFGKTAWSYLPPLLANYYLCKDVDLVPKLFAVQQAALEKKPKLKSLFWDLEMPMLNIVYEMERKGLRIDEKYFVEQLTPEVYTGWAKAMDEMRPIVEPYRHLLDDPTMPLQKILSSPKALKQIYFNGRGVPKIKFATLKRDTKKESPTYKKWVKLSLDKNAIAELKGTREDMRLLGEFRRWDTRRKLVIDQIPKLWKRYSDGTVRVHPTINEIGTKSGRQSMQKPNGQQQPPEVRQAFIPDEDEVLISFDFSQQEMRWMAHYSRDPKLIDIFTISKLDMYSQMAVDVFELSPEEFVDEHVAKLHPARKQTKTTVLGTSYGMMEAALSRRLGLTLERGTEIYNRYFDTYSEIRTYQDRTAVFAKANGYIPTILGRERQIDPTSYGWERAAMNQPIQGSAADQCKLAAIKCHALIKANGWPMRIWLMIHDEIIFAVNRKWIEVNKDAILQIKHTMETAIPLIVPVLCHYEVETRWGEKMDIEKYWDAEEFEDEAA